MNIGVLHTRSLRLNNPVGGGRGGHQVSLVPRIQGGRNLPPSRPATGVTAIEASQVQLNLKQSNQHEVADMILLSTELIEFSAENAFPNFQT